MIKKSKKASKTPSHPRVFDGMYGEFQDLGGFRFTAKGSDFEVEWRHCGQEKQTALFSALCDDKAKATDRRDLGLLISSVAERQAQQVMDSIGGPPKSWSYSAPIRKVAEEWAGWAADGSALPA